MKRQTILSGYLLILAAIGFWVSWFLMPDPGTTDTAHILKIVKESRMSVLCSVIMQIAASIAYVFALFSFAQAWIPQRKITWLGIALLGIGAMGMCADAFFHLLAWFMTDESVTIQKDVVKVMDFMQTDALIFLIPLLLAFFIGSILITIGLNKQGAISAIPKRILIIALSIGLLGAIIGETFSITIPFLTLIVLGMFATGQALAGFELMKASLRENYWLSFSGPRPLSKNN